MCFFCCDNLFCVLQDKQFSNFETFANIIPVLPPQFSANCSVWVLELQLLDDYSNISI